MEDTKQDEAQNSKPSVDESALDELALEEILRDIKRGSERAEELGAIGWRKNPNPPTNKTFLRNMLASTLRDDRPFKKREFHPHHHRNNHGYHRHHHDQPRDQSPKRNSDPDPPFRYNDPPKPKYDFASLEFELGESSSFLAEQFNNDWKQDETGHSAQIRPDEKKEKSRYGDYSLEEYDDWRHSLKRPRLYSSKSAKDSDSDQRNGHRSKKKNSSKKYRKHRRRTSDDEGDHSSHKRKKRKKSKKSKRKSKKSHKKSKD